VTEVSFDSIPGIRILEGTTSVDNRGSFTKYFDTGTQDELKIAFSPQTLAIAKNAKQGTLRGLHFQSHPFSEEKVIYCLSGSIIDVVVDLRHASKTYGNWAGIEINELSNVSLFLPQGLAHGYQTLEDETTLLYGLTSEYRASNAHVLNYADPDLNILWPLTITEISQRDRNGLSFLELTQQPGLL